MSIVQGNQVVKTNFAAINDSLVLDVASLNTARFEFSGTYSFTAVFEASIDTTNGIDGTWFPFQVTNVNTGAIATSHSTANATVAYEASVSLASKVRVRLSAFTSAGTHKVLAAGSYAAITPLSTYSISNMTPGTAAANLGKAEDAVHASGDVGVEVLAVRYEALTSPVSAANDYSFTGVDDLAKTIVMPYAPMINQVQGVTAAITGTTDTAVIAAPGASVRNYITSLEVVNSSGTATVVAIKDGSTIIAYIYAPANGYNDAQFPTPLKLSANAALNVACLTTAANVFVSAQGFKAL